MSLTSSAIIHKRTKEQWTVFWTSFCSRCLRCTTHSSQSTIPTWTRCGVHWFRTFRTGVHWFEHRKNCEWGPGHSLTISHMTSMSWFQFLNLSGKVNCVTKLFSLSLSFLLVIMQCLLILLVNCQKGIKLPPMSISNQRFLFLRSRPRKAVVRTTSITMWTGWATWSGWVVKDIWTRDFGISPQICIMSWPVTFWIGMTVTEVTGSSPDSLHYCGYLLS